MNTQDFTPTISIITATRNVENTILALYESLKNQTYRRFEWIVVDGASEDSTISLLRTFSKESGWLRFTSARDFGIYDAINKGIEAALSKYYVVVGADDVLTNDALARYADMCEEGEPDVILANVLRSGKVIGGFRPRRAWIGHSKVFPGPHSVGMLFRKSLHEKFGGYSHRFPLLADGYFLKILLKSGLVRFVEASFIAGSFSNEGISSTRKLQTLAETWQIQMLTERFPFVQTCLFIGKVICRYPSVMQEIVKRCDRDENC